MLVGAYLYQCKFDEQEKQLFKVIVLTGITAQAGMRVTLVPKDLWDRMLRNEELEKSDAARLDALTLLLNFMPCRPEGCAAEIEATADLLTALKSGGGLRVGVITESGTSFRGPMPHLRRQLTQRQMRQRRLARV